MLFLAIDIGTLWDTAWPWSWPSISLLLWLTLTLWAVSAWRRWVTRRFSDGSLLLSQRLLTTLGRIILLGSWLAGLYLWVIFVPLDPQSRGWVRTHAEPWIFATLLTVGFLALGFFGIRRGLLWLEKRAATSETVIDDALVEGLNRPMYVALVLISLNLWAAIAPIPPGVQGFVSRASETSVIVLVILFLDGLVQGWMIARSERSKVLKTSGIVIRATARGLFYTIGGVMVLSSFGLDVTPVLATLGIGSAAAGFALKGTLEDFLAGLLIAADQPLTVGDFVIVDEQHQGWVLSIGWRTTRLLTRFDMHVIVPNSKLSAATFVNTSRPREDCRFHAVSMVAFTDDLDQVVQIATELAEQIQREDPRAVASYRAFAFIECFQPGYVELRTWLCAKSWDAHFGLRDVFLRRLHQVLRAEGVAIASPHHTLEIKSPRVELAPHQGSNTVSDIERSQ